jgi:hypothetical protein
MGINKTSNDDWKTIDVGPKIEKVVGYFVIVFPPKVCWTRFKVKIIETQDGELIGVPNLSFKGVSGRAGNGHTIAEALQDTVSKFLLTLSEKGEFHENDLDWVDPNVF